MNTAAARVCARLELFTAAVCPSRPRRWPKSSSQTFLNIGLISENGQKGTWQHQMSCEQQKKKQQSHISVARLIDSFILQKLCVNAAAGRRLFNPLLLSSYLLDASDMKGCAIVLP